MNQFSDERNESMSSGGVGGVNQNAEINNGTGAMSADSPKTGETPHETSVPTREEPKNPPNASSYEQHSQNGQYIPYQGYQQPMPDGGYYGNNQYQYQYQNQPPVYRQPQAKSKKSGVIVAVSVIAVICIILSGTAAYFGASLAWKDGDTNVSVQNGIDNSGNSSSVQLHRDVTTVVSPEGESEALSTEAVAALVCDSVVEITTESKTVGYYQYVTQGAGSGVIISEDGYVITNNHVIYDSDNNKVADTVTVRLRNGQEYIAQLVGTDEDSDIAVLKIEATGLSYATFSDSDNIAVGQAVLAVGNPLGELGGTVTEGIISALDREIKVDGTPMTLLQTSAAINPGNSGGGLFNMAGKLVGIVNAKSSGTGIEGLGFAIPSNIAHSVAEQLIEYGYVRGKVFLGISLSDITSSAVAYRYFGSTATGVYVTEVSEGYNSGSLKYGDRIIAVDGIEITSRADVVEILSGHSVGDTLEFTFYRSGKLTTAVVTCYEKIPDGVSFN